MFTSPSRLPLLGDDLERFEYLDSIPASFDAITVEMFQTLLILGFYTLELGCSDDVSA